MLTYVLMPMSVLRPEGKNATAAKTAESGRIPVGTTPMSDLYTRGTPEVYVMERHYAIYILLPSYVLTVALCCGGGR